MVSKTFYELENDLQHDLGHTDTKCMRTEKEGLRVERENTWNPLEVYIMHLLRLIRPALNVFSLLFYLIRLALNVFLFSSTSSSG